MSLLIFFVFCIDYITGKNISFLESKHALIQTFLQVSVVRLVSFSAETASQAIFCPSMSGTGREKRAFLTAEDVTEGELMDIFSHNFFDLKSGMIVRMVSMS